MEYQNFGLVSLCVCVCVRARACVRAHVVVLRLLWEESIWGTIFLMVLNSRYHPYTSLLKPGKKIVYMNVYMHMDFFT